MLRLHLVNTVEGPAAAWRAARLLLFFYRGRPRTAMAIACRTVQARVAWPTHRGTASRYRW